MPDWAQKSPSCLFPVSWLALKLFPQFFRWNRKASFSQATQTRRNAQAFHTCRPISCTKDAKKHVEDYSMAKRPRTKLGALVRLLQAYRGQSHAIMLLQITINDSVKNVSELARGMKRQWVDEKWSSASQISPSLSAKIRVKETEIWLSSCFT